MNLTTTTVEVCYARTHHVWRAILPWRVGLTIAQALHESSFFMANAGWICTPVSIGVNGKLAALDDLVVAGVRIEVYRPLYFDPMTSRRRRAERRAREMLHL